MKKLIVMCLSAVALYSCDNSTDDTNANSGTPGPQIPLGRKFNRQLLDLPYGEDPQQKMDVYLPMKPTDSVSKVFVLVHGGGWYSGDKTDFNYEALFFRSMFPEYTVVNLNYRLANAAHLGYTTQISDISQAFEYLNQHSQELRIGDEYAMVGVSAGAHLSMLYSYKYDTTHQVKAVCSIVGPADFSDPEYQGNVLYYSGLNFYTGYLAYAQNPEMYDAISPAKQVTASSPQTLMFYGDSDPLVANTQGAILKRELDKKQVYNELYQYPGAGHANWTYYQQAHVNEKTIEFFRDHF